MPELVALLIQGGIIGAVASVFGMLHRSAVRAHERRADDWRSAFELERHRADEATRQLATLLGAVRETASAA